jgi:hypothetical protein
MDRIGISFKSTLSPEDVRTRFIEPLRMAIEDAHVGIYSNYLRQFDNAGEPPEHLLMFQVRDFQEGLRLLRTTMEKLGAPPGTTLHNLNASDPMY